jgi:hypothetical protein
MKTPLAALRNAAARVAAGTAAGGAAGAALHAALPASAPLVDGTLNLVDVSGGLAVGGVLGALWAAEAALLGSGLVGDTVRAAGGVLGSETDRAAGDRMLSDVRKSLDRLRAVEGVQGQLLRLVLDLSGITSDPGVAKLAAAAEAARREPLDPAERVRLNARGSDQLAPPTPSPSPAAAGGLTDVLAMVVEATLEARLFDARIALIAVAALFVGGADLVLLAINNGLGG